VSRVLREGWEVRKLGEVLQKTETTDPTKKPNEKFVYLDVSSVNKESKEIENVVVLLGKDAPSRARKLVRTNDVIFATVRPTHSRVALITKKYNEQVCSTGYFVLRGKEFIYNQYLYYFLLTDEFNRQMEKLQKGASYPAVTDTEVKNILLRYPPLPEQQKIVAILDEAFGAIEKAKTNAKHNLTHAKELFESYLQSVFENKGEGWEEKSLGEIATVEYGYTDKSTEEGNFRYIRITDIDKDGELIENNKKYIQYSKEAEKFILSDKDLLMARTGATFAKVLLYNNCELSIFASYLIRIKFTEKIENEFYWYFTKTRYYWEQANLLSSGAAQPHFNGVALKQIIFSYPKSVDEQKLLIAKFKELSEQTKTLEKIYQQKINDLDELKKSILQKAFNGELT